MHNHCTLTKGATNRTVALTHGERLLLIGNFRLNFLIRRIQPKTWGGLFIADALPREGRRVHRHTPWDENVNPGARPDGGVD